MGPASLLSVSRIRSLMLQACIIGHATSSRERTHLQHGRRSVCQFRDMPTTTTFPVATYGTRRACPGLLRLKTTYCNQSFQNALSIVLHTCLPCLPTQYTACTVRQFMGSVANLPSPVNETSSARLPSAVGLTHLYLD